MKILSFNCRGLASLIKKTSLRRLVDLNQPDIVLLQETLGNSEDTVKILETLLPGWKFVGVDARGRSGGVASGWNMKRCRCDSSWGFQGGVGLDIWDALLGKLVTILNVYGPYLNRAGFWDSLLKMEFFDDRELVLGGDLNLSLGRSEVWGPVAYPDPLANFFIQSFASKNLLDIVPSKVSPTWRNRRVGDQRVAKRLDRFLVSESLANTVEVVRQWVGSGGLSDHSPIFLDYRGRSRKPASPFKFNPSWLKEESFLKLVQDLWVHGNVGNMDFAGVLFCQNLKRIKQATIKWAFDKRAQDEQTLRESEAAIELLLNSSGLGFLDAQHKEDLLSWEKKRNDILCEREATWRMKSRALWLQSGDENTKFFQAYAKGRKCSNTIWGLPSVGGELVTSFEGLAALGVEHFGALFKEQEVASIAEVIQVAQLFPRFVDEETNQKLMGEVTEKELSEVLHSFQKDKSPGPDGWPIEFFLGFLDLVGRDLLAVVEESRLAGFIHGPINSTFIALIPKSGHAEGFDDYRPISLCNCLYKIISKVITRRLKEVLSRHISCEQFGFLEGRQIHEAIGVAQEGLHSMKTLKLKGAVIKIDLSKAYDRVNWLYIRMLLTHLGFSYEFTRWVMACISTVSFAVLINGSASPFFTAGRGLRQGCPLSPLLFLLVAEGLSRFIIAAKRDGSFRGIPISQALYITHLLFVDDILLFCDGSRQSIDTLAAGFRLLHVAAGMLVNIGKSTISSSNLSEEDVRRISESLPYRTMALDAGLKYLGFFLKPNSYLKADWVWLVAKLEKRLLGWSHKWLSRAGRLVLVKSVLEAIPVFWMSLSWIPVGILDQLRKICFAFLWQGKSEQRSLVWVKWKRLAVPKALGGWGLKNIFLFAKALGAKVAWRLIRTQSLWTEVVYHKYIAPSSLLDWIRRVDKALGNCSVVWKALIKNFDLIGSGLVWRVGNGRSARLGLDPWVGSEGAHTLSDGLRRQLRAGGLIFLADVAAPEVSTLWHQGWLTGARIGLHGDYLMEWDHFVARLRGSHIRLSNREDELVWDHHPSGVYTPKAGYIQLNVDVFNRELVWWWKVLWKLSCPSKAKLFMWAVLENKAPTWEVLKRRSFQGPGMCALCRQEEETSVHLFINCGYSRAVWADICNHLGLLVVWEGQSILDAFTCWWEHHYPLFLRALPCIFIWGIWIARNKVIFQDYRTPLETVAAQAVSIVQHYRVPGRECKSRDIRVEQIDKKMPWGYFDGASQENHMRCGGGGILYKNDSHFFKFSAGLGGGSNNYAELMTLRLLLLYALEQGCLSLQVFGDSLLVIEWAKEIQKCNVTRLFPILEEVLLLKQQFFKIYFTHVYRERNRVADGLSKEGTQLTYGTWKIQIIAPTGAFSYYHRPFHEMHREDT